MGMLGNFYNGCVDKKEIVLGCVFVFEYIFCLYN